MRSFCTTTALIVLLVLAGSSTAFGQLTCSDVMGTRVCPITPGFGTLNASIAGDTLANGDRVDPGTVYELERDGVYLLNGSVENIDYHLRIQAAEGTGHFPILQPGVDLTGSSSEAFAVRGDLTLRGLYIVNIDDLGGLNANMFRIQSDNARIIVDDCYMEYTRQALFRLDSEGIKLYLTNSVARNFTNIDNMGNGRFIDTRGNTPDTLFVENNTLYTFTGAGLRHGGGVIPFLHFNHNTIYNGGNQLLRAERGINVRITNNMLVNPTTNPAFVADDSTQRPIIQLDSLAVPDLTEEDRNYKVMYNNVVYTSTWTDYYDSVDSLVMAPLFNKQSQALIDANPNMVVDNNISEVVDFADAPASTLLLEATILRIQGLEGDGNTPDYRAESDKNGTFNESGMALIGLATSPREFDFSYPMDSDSYTAADGGFPVGDLNWFPAEKAAWLEWLATGTSVENESELPGFFKLQGNYPNPFNPVTSIQLTLDRTAVVDVEIYDLLGRKLRSLPAETFAAGPATIRISADGLSSGMLLYKVRAQSVVGQQTLIRTGRMILIK